MRRVDFFLLVVICFGACKSGIKSQLTSKDTSDIVEKILNEKQLYNDLIIKPDTLFIVKSKTINKSWPSKTHKFKLAYIERTKKNEDMIDLSPPSFYDKQTKIDFGRFIFNKGTVDISFGLYEFQKFSIYDYKLEYKNEVWTIVKSKKRVD